MPRIRFIDVSKDDYIVVRNESARTTQAFLTIAKDEQE